MKGLSESWKEMMERAAKIWDEHEFLLGVGIMCKGAEASAEMLKYMDTHPEATSSDILEYAVYLCEKYNPDLIEE